MKYLKKVSSVPLEQTEGHIIDSFNTSDDHTTNAPSLNAVEQYTKRQIATAYLTSEISAPSNAKITFQGIRSTTDKLTLSNGGIRIGAGVSKVLVNGNVFLAANANNSYLWTQIRKSDGTEISVAIDNYNTYFASTSHSPRLAEVSEGMIIYLNKMDNAGGTIRAYGNTYMTVEIIE
jgi:hypothetical protein